MRHWRLPLALGGLGHFRLAAGVTVLLAIVLHLLARFDRSER